VGRDVAPHLAQATIEHGEAMAAFAKVATPLFA
jgi:hypothetical protein